MKPIRFSNHPVVVLKDEKGVALVLVLAMLAVLIILGTFALSNSTLEIKISGNYRATHEALNAAERGLNYAVGNLTDGLDLNADLSPAGGSQTFADDILQNNSGLDTLQPNGVDLVTSGPPPAGSGQDVTTGSNFHYNYFVVDVHGRFPAGAPNPARSEIEVQVGRLVIK